MQERLKPLSNGWMPLHEPLVKAHEFMAQSATAHINGLTISSLANTPVRVTIKKSPVPMLFIPLFGSGTYRSKDENIIIRAEHRAALLPKGDYIGESTLRSSIVLFTDPVRLESTIRNMLGVENNGLNFIELNRPQSLLLRYGSISFDRIFRQHADAIDQLSSRPDLLHLSGVDDCIYRAMAMMLKPELFKLEANISQSYSKNLLDRVCQYVQENKHQSITLTDLERVSCMSRRNLHYAFQRTFHCTPMQWVRVQRLETARSMLIKAGSNLTVTAIAFLCGFNRASTFSDDYRLRFGELPSETIAGR